MKRWLLQKMQQANVIFEFYKKRKKPRIAKVEGMWYSIHIHAMRGESMDTAKTIKELRESTGMSRKEFSEHTGIPVRTLEDWEAGRRTPPDYLPRLIAYQLKFEEKVARKEDRNVSVIQDAEGNKIVVINDIVFKGKRCVQWEDVEEYLKRYVGEFYSIVEDSEIIYIGSELPNEYA